MTFSLHDLRHAYLMLRWHVRQFLIRWDGPLFILACIAVVSAGFFIASTAYAEEPDCGGQGGIFGTPFKPQWDRGPAFPVKVTYFDTAAEVAATCNQLSIMFYDGIGAERAATAWGCADSHLRIDRKLGHIFVLKDVDWAEKHERCHIRFGAWHP